MKEVMKNLDQAFGLLSQMVVNGDNVDLLASARMAIRVAYARAESLGKEVDEDGKHDRQTAEDAERGQHP